MLADLILETTNAPGSSATITLLGAAAGRRSFNTGFGVGPSFYYVMSNGADFEVGIGSLASSTSMNRTTVLNNSANTTARIVFSGLTNVYCTMPAARFLYRDTNLRLQMAGQRIEGLAASTAADHAPRQGQVLMLATGGSVTGTITATRHAADNTFYQEVSAGSAITAYDANDYSAYTRSSDTLAYIINGNNRFYLNPTDVVVQGVPLTLTVGGTSAGHATRKDYVDSAVNGRLSLSGGQVNGNLTITGAAAVTSTLQVYNSGNGSVGTIYFGSQGIKKLESDNVNWYLGGQPLVIQSLAATGDIATSAGRMSGLAPRGVGSGWSIVDASARFGSWVWVDSGTYIQIDVDGVARSISTNASDRRLKEDIAPASRPALPDIRKIEFADFRFKKLAKAPSDCEMPLQRGGFIAQQIAELRPEWVDVLPDEQGTLAPNTLLLLGNALQAIQELDIEVQALKAEVAAMKAAPAARKRRATKS